jgi:sulfatase modifying factor 1
VIVSRSPGPLWDPHRRLAGIARYVRYTMTADARHEQMIAVGPGRATLTDRRTRHTWTVELAPYLLAAVPVTQARYAEITGESPSAARGDGLPVECVSWLAAVRYCNALSERSALTPAYPPPAGDSAGDSADGADVRWDRSADGYRLPTEAEWEYACRAGTSGARYGELADIAWYRGNALGAVHEVGSKEPNAWGFHDLLGNVWEWCWDVYDREVYGSYRVLRGGGWSDEHWSCRASVRRRGHPTFHIDDVGFRVARSVHS